MIALVVGSLLWLGAVGFGAALAAALVRRRLKRAERCLLSLWHAYDEHSEHGGHLAPRQLLFSRDDLADFAGIYREQNAG